MRDDDHATSINGHELHPESLMMGYGYRPEWSEGALKSPIFQTSTFVFKTAEAGKKFFEVAYGLRQMGPSETLGLIYSRLNNPDLEILEDRLKLWDGAEAGAVFTSGMAAISTTILTFLRPGDVLIHSDPLYGGTHHQCQHVLTEFGIHQVSFIAGRGPQALEQAVEQANSIGRVAMIYLETPANPTNGLIDIEHCASVARRLSTPEQRVLLAVDNTFLGPLWQHPIQHGADLVLYSLTKYVGGHSDLIAGACLGSHEDMQKIRASRTFFGSMAGPWTGWLLLRSLETLKLRMTSEMKNARYVADYLLDHPKVDRVLYLGHLDENDPDHAIYRKQCLAPGGMISFEVRGGEREAFRFLNALQLIRLAVSLGGTESLAEHPATMTHADVPSDQQRQLGISPSMVRLSVGVEHPSDIIADIEQALAAV
ncbi:MAG: cystathionine gamma-synthase family protein [Candidatus Latescibacterota bacterium]|nr:MAG: cystathionine gamma-synthase family protein [Candidatus Latescibacterota bacterium]